MTHIVPGPSFRRKLLAGVAVLVLHLLAGFLLLRAFAPQAISSLTGDALPSIAVTLTRTPPPPNPPEPQPKKVARKMVAAAQPKPAGVSGAPAPRAIPRSLEAPIARIPITVLPAAPVAGVGDETQSGGAEAGHGTGATGVGRGTGVGASGYGAGGGGGGSMPEKIAGDINSARDYPRASREQRINSRVVIALTVEVDGRATNCRVLQPSPDPNAGPVTCALAMKRFRFRPARDAAGRPVEAQFGWQQRWFY